MGCWRPGRGHSAGCCSPNRYAAARNWRADSGVSFAPGQRAEVRQPQGAADRAAAGAAAHRIGQCSRRPACGISACWPGAATAASRRPGGRPGVRVGGPGRPAVRAEPLPGCGRRTKPWQRRPGARRKTRPNRRSCHRSLVPRRCWPRWPGRPAPEVPGVRFVLRPEFDVTPETAPERRPDGRPGPRPCAAEAGIPLGEVLDRLPGARRAAALPRSSLNRHVFVCGATGAGKSQTVRHLLESATAGGDPVAGDRARQGRVQADGRAAARVPRSSVIRAGRPGRGRRRDQPAGAGGRARRDPVPAAGPRRPGPGPVPGRVRGRRAVPAGAGGRADPLLRAGRAGTWSPASPPSRAAARLPGAGRPAGRGRAAWSSEIGYGREITDNVRGFVTVRIG